MDEFVNTNDHCRMCLQEIDLNNVDDQWEIICSRCWRIYERE